MLGRLIVLEGLDGSGKATQTALLYDWLADKVPNRLTITFPDYDSPSSALIKLYLNGEIGGLDEVNVYAATSFYAADRYISYKTHWEDSYESGALIIADRYTTSNIIYQMAKLPKEEWEAFIGWIYDYEFGRLGLPAPDLVIYLDVPPKVSQQLILERYGGDESQKDLHEKNLDYLLRCRTAALFAAERLGWRLIDCTQEDKLLTIEAIGAKISTIVSQWLTSSTS